MRIPTTDGRDMFPKLGLEDDGRRYIGDGIPRCDAMPAKLFLRKGAKYRYLGSSSMSVLGRADPFKWEKSEDSNPRLVLSESSSELYDALCNADPSDTTGTCRFQSQVILDKTLRCDGTCTATSSGPSLAGSSCECDIDEPRVVRLDPSPATGSSLPTYYEYVRTPCVQLAFPEANNLVAVSEIDSDGEAICADARLPVASGACCDSTDGGGAVESICIFQGERVTYSTAVQRCGTIGKTTCSWDSVPTNWDCGTDLTKWKEE